MEKYNYKLVGKRFRRSHWDYVYTYECEDYIVNIHFECVPHTDVMDMDVNNVIFIAKEGHNLPVYDGEYVHKIGSAGYWGGNRGRVSFHYTDPGIHIENITEGSDERLQKAKQAAFDFDEVVRHDFPGYCFFPRLDEKEDPVLYKEVEEKRKTFYVYLASLTNGRKTLW